MMGLNLWAALVIILVVCMIIVHMIGCMAISNINANAVSLVNLVMVSRGSGVAVFFILNYVAFYSVSCCCADCWYSCGVLFSHCPLVLFLSSEDTSRARPLSTCQHGSICGPRHHLHKTHWSLCPLLCKVTAF